MYPLIQIAGFLFVLGGAAVHTLSRSWTRSLLAFAAQSLGIGILAWQFSPLPMAMAKCVVGWLAAALISVTLAREGVVHAEISNKPVSVIFRASLLLLILSAVLSLLPEFSGIFRHPPYGILAVTAFLIGTGLINIGFSEHACRVAIGLLTALQGFELGYLWMEQSLLVIGLLAAADLAIVLALITLFSFSIPASAGEEGK